jgi:UDP-N-acetyl-D-mannosaminuronic acid transferase (WecB/TagA/CpsF family)
MRQETKKHVRRNDEQLIADLHAKIEAVKARAARKQAKANPAIRHTSAAVKSIDKAMEATNDNAVRTALQEARAALSACLALDGVLVAGGSRAPRSRVAPEALLEYVKEHPGQRGEEIAAALGTDSRSMRPAMQKLIATKKVKTHGQRRAMTYRVA